MGLSLGRSPGTGLPSAQSLILGFTTLTLAVGLAAFAWLTWSDHRDTVAEAERSLAEIAQLMEEHTRAALQVNEIQLQRIADLIGGRPLSALAGSEADWRELNRILARSPMGHSVWIFDANADLALSSVKPSGMVLNVRDREYFTALANSRGHLFISPVITGRLTGGLLFPMALRLEEPDGTFKGVVALSIRAEYFLDFYRKLRPEASSVFTLSRLDGSMVLRWPQPEKTVDPAVVRTSALFAEHLPQARQGLYRAPSVFDGVERIVAYRALPDHSLVVMAGMATDALLHDWMRRTARNAVFSLAGLGLIVAFATFATRAARAEAQAMARHEQKARALAGALSNMDVLFQEIHHRVKNNLQVVSSMLMMQSMKVGDEATRAALQQSLDRIHSMGLVHQTLYLSNEAARVDLQSYLGRLAQSLDDTYGAAERGIVLRVEADPGGLDLDKAVPLGLLANEALTNALKHGFPQGRGGTVTLGLRRVDGLVRFFVQDDGTGLKPEHGEGVGMTLVRALAHQLDGELTLDGTEGGTRLAVSFPV